MLTNLAKYMEEHPLRTLLLGVSFIASVLLLFVTLQDTPTTPVAVAPIVEEKVEPKDPIQEQLGTLRAPDSKPPTEAEVKANLEKLTTDSQPPTETEIAEALKPLTPNN